MTTEIKNHSCLENDIFPVAANYITFQSIYIHCLGNDNMVFKNGNIPWNKGKINVYSDETKKQISDTLKGNIPWNKGIPCSEKTRLKISNANKRNTFWLGKHHTKETCEKISNAKRGCSTWNKGIPMSDESKQKCSDANKGKHPSEETRKKMSISQKGRTPTIEARKKISDANKGKVFSLDTRKKMSDAKKGNKAPTWNGGTSFEPYCPKFNDPFKESIRDKFDRTCFLCGISESEQMNRQKMEEKRQFRLSIHHVNYDKNCLCNDVKCEFVPLCVLCHSETNHYRDYHEYIIMQKIKDMKLV